MSERFAAALSVLPEYLSAHVVLSAAAMASVAINRGKGKMFGAAWLKVSAL